MDNYEICQLNPSPGNSFLAQIAYNKYEALKKQEVSLAFCFYAYSVRDNAYSYCNCELALQLL